MTNALAIGAAGMQAQQSQVDAIANNLANVNTPAYKKTRVAFTDLVGRALLDANGGMGVATPMGVAAASTSKLFDPGELRKTEAALDVAIQGDGFLELAMPDGTRAFTRGGTLKVNADGQLATQAGLPLKGAITIPDNAESVVIASTGRVQVRVAGQSALTDAGQLELARFTHSQGLSAQGGNVYRATDASGEPSTGKPGEEGLGTLAQGYLEGSNVKLVEEMVQLMVAQRAYEASVKVVQASDEMLGLVNGLRR
jgi:flagellar basal-body rod protein FlgG